MALPLDWEDTSSLSMRRLRESLRRGSELEVKRKKERKENEKALLQLTMMKLIYFFYFVNRGEDQQCGNDVSISDGASPCLGTQWYWD
jgi:hypothetical protein